MIALRLLNDLFVFSLSVFEDIKTTTKSGGLANSPEALRKAGNLSPD
jgi:hypothetical protein